MEILCVVSFSSSNPATRYRVQECDNNLQYKSELLSFCLIYLYITSPVFVTKSILHTLCNCLGFSWHYYNRNRYFPQLNLMRKFGIFAGSYLRDSCGITVTFSRTFPPADPPIASAGPVHTVLVVPLSAPNHAERYFLVGILYR